MATWRCLSLIDRDEGIEPGFPGRYLILDESTWAQSKEIGLGEQTFLVGVALGAAVVLHRFDIRPVQTDVGGRVPDNTIVITDAWDVSVRH